ncbi:MAG: cell division protein FtsA [Muribaculaceae bacterium]|nr:cell division protein FtsA [Muribaculaceae bacterium]
MNRSIVAIEIGSSNIKGALGELDPSGALLIRGIEEVRQQPNIVSYGHVHNVREVANELKRVINALNSRLNNAEISGVYVAIGGRSLMSTPATIEQRLEADTEITPEMVDELLSRARSISPDRNLLDVQPVEFRIDGKAQGKNPIGIIGNELSANVNLVTIRSQIIRNMQLAITEKLGLEINGFVIRPIAEANLVMTPDERRLGAMLVDFGAETTTVAIYKKDTLKYLATIPLGSRHITRDLTAIPLTEERAEALKCSVGDAWNNKPTADAETAKINNYVRWRAGEIAANIAAQIGFANMKPEELPSGIVLVGGGANLTGFVELLGSETGMTVRRGTTPPSVRVLGAKLNPAQDLDIVAIINSLVGHEFKPCITDLTPKPEVKPEVKPENVSTNVTTVTEVKETEETDEWEDRNEEPPRPKRPSFWSRLGGYIKNTMAPLDENDEDF